MNHIQISIQAHPYQQEILISQLADLGATGFEETATHLLAYFPEGNFQSYEINNLVKEFAFEIDTIQEQNWNALWESNFEPVVVDEFCAVRADFHEPIKNVQHEIIITPKMSFGTGHHATTYMMMQQMHNMDFFHKTVFDFGTGTGILAILAKKLGAAEITAIDIDEWSITNASENFDGNSINDISLYQSAELPAKQFDIVLANINKNVLMQEAAALRAIVKEDGNLLLSGLLKEDEVEILSCFHQYGFKLKSQSVKGNWISLLL